MKVDRKKLVALMESHDIAVSKKGKPLSNEKLLQALTANIDEMSDDEGNFEDELAALLSTALDEEEEIVITGDDPTVPKKSAKAPKEEAPAKKKGKKAAAAEADDEDDEEEAPAKKKGKNKPAKAAKEKKPKAEKAERDKWNSNPNSSAGAINAIFFANKKKPMTIDDVYTALDDSDVTKQRVRDHIRRLHRDEILLKDAKDRYSINKDWSKPSSDE